MASPYQNAIATHWFGMLTCLLLKSLTMGAVCLLRQLSTSVTESIHTTLLFLLSVVLHSQSKRDFSIFFSQRSRQSVL